MRASWVIIRLLLFRLVLRVSFEVILYPLSDLISISTTATVQAFSNSGKLRDVLLLLDNSVVGGTSGCEVASDEAVNSGLDDGVLLECSTLLALLLRVELNVAIFVVRLVGNVVSLGAEYELQTGHDSIGVVLIIVQIKTSGQVWLSLNRGGSL